jgi:hypothetical protein
MGLGLVTETAFFANRNGGLGEGRNADAAHKQAKKNAEAEGVNISGKEYFPSLAEKPLDPKAWCGTTGEVEARARALGKGVRGGGINVDVAPPTIDDKKPYRVANDIVEKHVAGVEAEHGPLPKKERADLVEKTTKRLSGEHRTGDSLAERVE